MHHVFRDCGLPDINQTDFTSGCYHGQYSFRGQVLSGRMCRCGYSLCNGATEGVTTLRGHSIVFEVLFIFVCRIKI